MTKKNSSSPLDKKQYVKDVGQILVELNGKKDYYKPEEVKKAQKKSKWADNAEDIVWGMSIFCEHSDFDNYYSETEEKYDYIDMKSEMIQGLSVTEEESWFELPDIDFDLSWLDIGDAFEGIGDTFEGIAEGIGDVISGIFEGLG